MPRALAGEVAAGAVDGDGRREAGQRQRQLAAPDGVDAGVPRLPSELDGIADDEHDELGFAWHEPSLRAPRHRPETVLDALPVARQVEIGTAGRIVQPWRSRVRVEASRLRTAPAPAAGTRQGKEASGGPRLEDALAVGQGPDGLDGAPAGDRGTRAARSSGLRGTRCPSSRAPFRRTRADPGSAGRCAPEALPQRQREERPRDEREPPAARREQGHPGQGRSSPDRGRLASVRRTRSTGTRATTGTTGTTSGDAGQNSPEIAEERTPADPGFLAARPSVRRRRMAVADLPARAAVPSPSR